MSIVFSFYEIMSAAEFKGIFDELLSQGVLYVYEEDDILKGMFKLTPKQHRCSHITFLGGVAIHPSFSGKGCGQRMINEIVSMGKEQGFLRMELGVSTINSKAIHLYKKPVSKKKAYMKKYIYLQSENIFWMIFLWRTCINSVNYFYKKKLTKFIANNNY